MEAAQGMLLEPRHLILKPDSTSMRLDTVGWAGLPIAKRRCIRLQGTDRDGRLEIAVTPEGGLGALDDLWNALQECGVAPIT